MRFYRHCAFKNISVCSLPPPPPLPDTAMWASVSVRLSPPPPPSQFPVSRYMNVESASCRNNAGSKMRLNRFDPHTFANPTFICSSGSSLCGRFAFSRHPRSYTFLYVFHYKVLKWISEQISCIRIPRRKCPPFKYLPAQCLYNKQVLPLQRYKLMLCFTSKTHRDHKCRFATTLATFHSLNTLNDNDT